MSKRTLFLLGGYDLEMVTIRDILVDLGWVDITESKDFSQEKCFADNHLSWGATTDAYEDFMTYEGSIYGIELTEPDSFNKPVGYVRIDHHNEFAHKQSSIVQVCELLNMPLNRNIRLVAANDSGYIPAMQALGASEKEIDDIRAQDRKAQGVTSLDEELAEKSIKENSTLVESVLCVESLTSKFSPVTDRLYPYSKLLIFNKSTLNYYGVGISLLAEQFKELIVQQKAFYGGSENGFWGLVSNTFENEEIERIKSEIIKTVKGL